MGKLAVLDNCIRGLLISLTLTCVGGISTTVGATDWLVPDPQVSFFAENVPTPPEQFNIANPCVTQSFSVRNPNNFGKLQQVSGCVHRTKSFHFTNFRACLTNWYGGCSSVTWTAISFPGEDLFYRIEGIIEAPIDNCWQTSPDTDRFVYTCQESFYVIEDLVSHLTISQSTYETYFTFDTAGYSYLQNTQGASPAQKGTALSQNSHWAAIAVSNVGIVRLNMNSGQVQLITKDIPQSVSGGPIYHLSITSNGKYIAAGGLNVGAKLYEVSDMCGETANTIQESWYDRTNNITTCGSIDLTNYIMQASGSEDSGFRAFYYVRFTPDEQGIIGRYDPNTGISGSKYGWLTIHPANYVEQSIDYLALGDSYSSGEGDTEKQPGTNQKYYREWTDNEEDANANQPREKCHISTRSYPYVLAASMSLAHFGPKQWDSVACSGAKMEDVKDEGSSDYKGQGGVLSDFTVDTLKNTALTEFIPGRQKQIEFVKKYKPRAITLTMGGNDVGFGGKINLCATPQVSISQTCDIAKSENRAELKNTLLSQFDELSSLYIQLHEASRNTKIYVLGYPQFISGDPSGICAPNVVALDSSEREMIEESISYFNSIIEYAAKKAGVKYINIEHSLQGHKLCDTFAEKYVTGFAWSGDSEVQESFHPNAKGNAAIATAVRDALGNHTLLTYDACPDKPETEVVCPNNEITKASIDTPEYFQTNDTVDRKVEYKEVSSSEFVLGDQEVVRTTPYIFGPLSEVQIELHSDPIQLGSFNATANGELGASVVIPATVPTGYHTLILKGVTYSGEPIQYEQVVLVKSSDPNDRDDDNIPDATDKCLFITPADIDEDGDGIDDACDPMITQSTQPYRVRMGSASRNYDGLPENERYLYIERNIAAVSETGVTGDYDPDGDGWAVVGASDGEAPHPQEEGVMIPDVGPSANFLIKPTTGNGIRPVAYTRTANDGCVSIVPTSLAVVEAGQVRSVKINATRREECRSAALEMDIDNNSHPDNTQPLYVARNGDPSKGESANKLYLFRSHAAAEAQLGYSDYSPTGTAASSTLALSLDTIQPWNLLASTQNLSGFTYKKLVILSSTEAQYMPTVLATKNSICYAFQPNATTIIRQTTQPTRPLLKLTTLPEGVNCE